MKPYVAAHDSRNDNLYIKLPELPSGYASSVYQQTP